MMHALRAREKLEGSFDVDAERTYIDGVWAWIKRGEVAKGGRDLFRANCSIHLSKADCHV